MKASRGHRKTKIHNKNPLYSKRNPVSFRKNTFSFKNLHAISFQVNNLFMLLVKKEQHSFIFPSRNDKDLNYFLWHIFFICIIGTL